MKVSGRLHTAIWVMVFVGCGAPPNFDAMPESNTASAPSFEGEGGDVGLDDEFMEDIGQPEALIVPADVGQPEPMIVPQDAPVPTTPETRSLPQPRVPRGIGSGNAPPTFELNAGEADDSERPTAQPFDTGNLEFFNVPDTAAPVVEPRDEDELSGVTLAAEDGFVLEKVYYGTNRRPDDSAADRWAAYGTALRRFQVLLVVGLALCGSAFYVPGRRILLASIALLCLGGAGWSGRQASLEHQQASLDDGNDNRRYGNEIHFVDGKHGLERGYCWVSIPDKVHERGSGQMELPGLFELRADPEKHFTLQRVEKIERAAFLEDLRAAVQQSPAKHAFVFIHGYNVLFPEAALRTAQLRYDLDFDGPAAFFSWPSNGSLLSYASDEETANLTERSGVLHDFLTDFINETGAESVHLIAHSMGNRLMTRALEKLPESTNSQGHKTISQLIMAAPDVNPAEFMLLADRIRELTRARTLYASEKDIALIGSEVLRMSNYTRLGQGGQSRVIVEGVQTIDASELSSELFDLGHSYYVHPKVMQDLKHLLNSPAVVPQRPWLLSVDDYWIFRNE
jgi:esterase/lipase superfamily enzyme